MLFSLNCVTHLSDWVCGGAPDGDPGAADALRVEGDGHHVGRQRPLPSRQLITIEEVQFWLGTIISKSFNSGLCYNCYRGSVLIVPRFSAVSTQVRPKYRAGLTVICRVRLALDKKLLGMQKMVATFYSHCLKTGSKREWRRGKSSDSRM